MSQTTTNTNKLTLGSLRINVSHLQTTKIDHSKQLVDLSNTNTNFSNQIETFAIELCQKMKHLKTYI